MSRTIVFRLISLFLLNAGSNTGSACATPAVGTNKMWPCARVISRSHGRGGRVSRIGVSSLSVFVPHLVPTSPICAAWTHTPDDRVISRVGRPLYSLTAHCSRLEPGWPSFDSAKIGARARLSCDKSCGRLNPLPVLEDSAPYRGATLDVCGGIWYCTISDRSGVYDVPDTSIRHIAIGDIYHQLVTFMAADLNRLYDEPRKNVYLDHGRTRNNINVILMLRPNVERLQ